MSINDLKNFRFGSEIAIGPYGHFSWKLERGIFTREFLQLKKSLLSHEVSSRNHII